MNIAWGLEAYASKEHSHVIKVHLLLKDNTDFKILTTLYSLIHATAYIRLDPYSSSMQWMFQSLSRSWPVADPDFVDGGANIFFLGNCTSNTV